MRALLKTQVASLSPRRYPALGLHLYGSAELQNNEVSSISFRQPLFLQATSSSLRPGNMDSLQSCGLCDFCVGIFEQAAGFLTSHPAKDHFITMFDSTARGRLAVNASESSCHMCILFARHIPRSLMPFKHTEQVVLLGERSRHKRDAASLSLLSFENAIQTMDSGTLQIQGASLPHHCFVLTTNGLQSKMAMLEISCPR